MNKFITTITLIALTTTAFVGSAFAGPGNGNNNQQAGGGSGPQINISYGSIGGGKGGSSGGGGGEIASPGDAFYPDTSSVGDPRSQCDRAGGRTVRQVIDGAAVMLCVL